jgi:hypothetical protein
VERTISGSGTGWAALGHVLIPQRHSPRRLGILLRRPRLVLVVPILQCAAENIQGLGAASADFLCVDWRQDPKDVETRIPPGQPHPILVMGAPVVGPIVDLVEDGGIRVCPRNGGLILVAQEVDDSPEVPCTQDPEIDSVKVPV